MSEIRLIDANALKEEISSLRMVITGLRCGKGVLSEYAREYLKSILRIIDESPTIDAVTVVRCKDCLYRGHSDLCPMKYLVYDEANHSSYYADFTMDDYYCSFEKRKDNHETD